MYAPRRARVRASILLSVLVVLGLTSSTGTRASAQEPAMRWDGLLELVTGRFSGPPPTIDPPLPADAPSTMPRHAISADGRFILFDSEATTLGGWDRAIYLRDRRTNELQVMPTGPVGGGTLSADGFHVAYEVCNPYMALYPRPDFAPICDVYVIDRRVWGWTLVSALPDGTWGDDHSGGAVLSSNGRFVVFRTKSGNLTGGTPGVWQLVLRDRDADGNGIYDEPGTAVLETISVSSSGSPGNDESDTPEVSDDGRFVAFRSLASNLAGGDQNGVWDVFFRDRLTQQTTRLNLRAGANESTSPIDSPQISMTPDGRYVAYASADPLLAPAAVGDLNGVLDVYVHDTTTGQTSRVDIGWGPPVAGGLVPGNGPTSWPTLSADGRYVSLQSSATNTETPAPQGSTQSYVVDRELLTVTRVSVRPDGELPDRDSVRPSLSADGSVVTFLSKARNLSPNAQMDIDQIYAVVHFELTPASIEVPGSGGTATFTITTQPHTQWWIDWSNWADWWQIESYPMGNGNGELRFRVHVPNPQPTRRTYNVRVLSKTAQLTQLEGMSLTSVSPSVGPGTGGTAVTITGTGFEPGVRAMFDGIEAATEFVNSTTVVATTPEHVPGTVWVGTFSADYSQNAWLDFGFRYADTTPPKVFAFTSAEPSPTGWFNQNVWVNFWYSDSESEVTSATGCNTVLVSTDTPGTTFTCTATSEGGTASASVTVKRDTAPPSLTIASPVAGALYELGVPSATAFTCSDPLSGVATCGASAPSGAPLDTSTPGWHNFHADALDNAGNIGMRDFEYAVSTNVCVAGLPETVAWWRMEGNTRNARSNSTSPLTRVGLTSDVYVDAVAGLGYRFEGVNGYLNSSYVIRIPPNLKFGLAAWVKPSANTYGTIIRKKDQYSVARTSTGTLAWAFRKFNNPTLTYVNTGVPIPLNTWTHVAVVLDGTVVTTYLNGRPAHVEPNVGDVYTWDTMSDTVTIGGAQDRPDFFKGALDELQIFMNTVSAAKVEELFLAGPAGACVPKFTEFVWTAPIQATYGQSTYHIQLTLRDEYGQPVVGRTVSLDSIVGATPLSTSTANRVTDGNGMVVWDAPLKNAPPGNYVDYMSATFVGDDGYVRTYAEPTVVVNKATPVITWTPLATNYGLPLGPWQLNATASVAGSFSYTPASGTVLPSAGSHTLSVTFTPTNTTYYNSTTVTTTLTVNKAAPTVTATGGTFTYDGQPHPATGTVRGVGGVVLGTPTLTYNGDPNPPVNAGTYAVVASYTGSANYNAASATATITISKAAAGLSWSAPAAIVYGTTLGASQLNATAAVPGTFTYTPAVGTVLNAGAGQALSVTFDPTDGVNYSSASTTRAIDVTKAAPVVTVAGGTFTYDCQPHPATGAVTGVGGAPLTPLSLAYNGGTAAPVTAGTYAVVASYAGDANYLAATGNATLTIEKASPQLQWGQPAAIVYGSPLGGTQLNATANVPGSFAYTPASGAVLGAGAGQALTAQFTPADAVNYTSGSVSTTIDVSKSPATVSVTGGAFTYDGQPHAATGTVTGAGGAALGPLTFSYNGQPSAPVNAGSYAVVASFAGDANHEAASATGTLSIGRAAPALVWNAPAGIVYGTPLSGAQLSATSNVPGTFAYSPAAGAVLGAGSHALAVTFTPADAVNYTPSAAGTTITVGPALLTVRGNDVSKLFGAPLPSLSASFAGFVNGDTPASLIGAVQLATSATQQSAVGAFPVVPSGVSSPNYAIAFVNGTLLVVKGDVTVSLSTSPEPSGLAQPMTFTATVAALAPAAGQPGGAVQFYDGATLLGTATLAGATATLTTAGLAAGSHNIEARYLGNASFNAGTRTTPHVVNGSASTPSISLTSSRNPATTGQSVTLTANISMSSGSVAGSIQFWDGGTLLGTSTISAGRATLTTSSLPNGSHAITARYLGSASAPPVISGVLVQAVGGSSWKNRTTTASLSSSANPATLGGTVTFTATIDGSSTSAPTGRILFMVNGSVVGDPLGVPVTLVSGTIVRAALDVSGLAGGAHKVTATYLGNSTYKGSTSSVTQGVN